MTDIWKKRRDDLSEQHLLGTMMVIRGPVGSTTIAPDETKLVTRSVENGISSFRIEITASREFQQIDQMVDALIDVNAPHMEA